MTATTTLPPTAAPPRSTTQQQRPSRKQSAASGQARNATRPPSAAPIQESPAQPVSGLLDITDGQAFLRRAGYQRGPDDVYLSPAQVQQYGLRKGDAVEGTARPPQPGKSAGKSSGNQDRSSGNRDRSSNNRDRLDKYPVLATVSAVNGSDPTQASHRPEFAKLTPLHPQERLRLENSSASGSATGRIIDLVAPIGKGQRGLIVSPPKAGKTMVLQAIAAAVAANHPEVHLMVVLVGERPEEVTDLRRSVHGEVVYSTFDQSAEEHIQVAELAIERAKRLVEQGRDVVVLLDSITRLGRAYNLAAPASSRILAGGVAVGALYPPRKFLGAARNVEDGGSLTLLCTALVETGSRMDDVFFEEFKGTGNMELRLRRDLAEKRIFPAIDAAPSSTRRDDLLMTAEEHEVMARLRRVLAELDPQQGIELLLDRTRNTASNAEFLRQIQLST
jgi:transcription termination factor Rho